MTLARLRGAMVEWLSEIATFDVFATITFKQAIPNEDGGLAMLDRQTCESTLTLFNSRLSKALLGKGAHGRGERLLFVPFVENGGGMKRWHAHVGIKKPDGVDLSDFIVRFVEVGQRLIWVHRITEVRPIANAGMTSNLAVMGYSSKEGIDALALSAVTFPPERPSGR